MVFRLTVMKVLSTMQMQTLKHAVKSYYFELIKAQHIQMSRNVRVFFNQCRVTRLMNKARAHSRSILLFDS